MNKYSSCKESLVNKLAAILQSDISAVTTKALAGGIANKGILLHEVYIGSSKKLILGKRTNVYEINKAKIIKQIDPTTVFPKIYEVDENNETIYMEYNSRAGEKLKFDNKNIKRIAQLIFRMNMEFDVLSSLSLKELGGFIRGCKTNNRMLENIIPFFGSSRDYRNDYNEMLEYFSNVKKVFSHNDIGWGNMALSSDSAQPDQFIDLGLVGNNAIGADLHNFARFAGERTHYNIAKEYSEIAKVKKDIVLFSSFFYAFLRSLYRYDRYVKSNSKEDILEIVSCYRLFMNALKYHATLNSSH